jgi:hypothetical protein
MLLEDGSRVLGSYLVGAIEVMRTAGKALEAARDTGGVPYRLASMIYRLR